MESRKLFQKGRFGDFSCSGLYGPLVLSTRRGTKSYQEGTHGCMCGTPSPFLHNLQCPPPTPIHSTHCPPVRDELGGSTPIWVLKTDIELFGQEFQDLVCNIDLHLVFVGLAIMGTGTFLHLPKLILVGRIRKQS